MQTDPVDRICYRTVDLVTVTHYSIDGTKNYSAIHHETYIKI